MFPTSILSRHAAFVQGWSVNQFKTAPLTLGAFVLLYLSFRADYYITIR